MSDLRKAADAAIYALRYGVKTINHLGGAIEAMPLHDAIESLRAALADPQPEPEHIGPVSNAMADRAEIDATLLESLPRRLLDVACRARSNECLFRDDELIEQAAHAIRGALLYAAPQAKQPQKERPDFIAGYTAGLADGKACAERDAKEPPPMFATSLSFDAREARKMIESAWLAGYYQGGYKHDSAYACAEAEKCADQWLGDEGLIDAPIQDAAPSDSCVGATARRCNEDAEALRAALAAPQLEPVDARKLVNEFAIAVAYGKDEDILSTGAALEAALVQVRGIGKP